MNSQEIMAMKGNINFSPKKKSILESIADYLSFSEEVRSLVEVLNSEIASPDTVVFRPISHPAGFVRLLTKRRLTIAESYIKLISHNKSTNYVERIEALQVLVHHIWHSKNLSMPINTARVQIALMKKAVKMRGNRRAQLELMSDFARASYGQTSVIRRLLHELDLIEVPETGEDLSQMSLGWDDHVHDSMTEGRKSPSQLVLDAFIKGISRITVAYYDVADRQTYEEIFLAGSTLGIRVQIGIEFSVGPECDRLHYLYIPTQDWTFEKLCKFLDNNEKKLAPFWDGLKENANRRHETVSALLENFNQTGLTKFNEPFLDQKILQMEPLSWESVEAVTAQRQANRIHLGQLIYQNMRPIALKRMLYLKNQYRMLKHRADGDPSSSWEADRCYKRYECAKHDYEELTPALCAEKYIAPQKQVDYASAFNTEDDIFPLLTECGGFIVFLHPLSRGLERAVDTLFKQYQFITDIEAFNLVDAISRDTTEIRRFATLLRTLMTGTVEQVETLLQEWRLSPRKPEDIEAIIQFFKVRPPYIRCSSDAVGWSSNIPGMGFVHESVLSPKSLKQLRKKGHAIVPQPVAMLLQAQSGLNVDDKKAVFLLSSTQILPGIVIEEEINRTRITPVSFWRYANTSLKSIILAIIGFIPTLYFLGIEYALIWTLITGFRNAIVDLIASAGIIIKSWELKSIDRENLCASLFFSGISVPILIGTKLGFDYVWGICGFEEGFLFNFTKFWCIAFANGLYLVAHNTLRGFDKAAIRGNFFRSVLSWPLATFGSYFLTPLGVPDVVQSKIWSEVVAGFIEGTVKNLKQNRLAQKGMLEVYRQILSPNKLYSLIARIDVLFFWAQYGQGKRALKKFLHSSRRLIKKLPPETVSDIQRANEIVFDAFTTEGSLESITYAILEFYPEENLTILTDFIGEYHDPFVDWLKHTYKK